MQVQEFLGSKPEEERSVSSFLGKKKVSDFLGKPVSPYYKMATEWGGEYIPQEKAPPEVEAILPTLKELAVSQVPGGRFLTKEGREEYKKAQSRKWTPEEATAMEAGPMGIETLKKAYEGPKTKEQILGEEAFGLMQWIAFPSAIRATGKLAKMALPKAITRIATMPIGKISSKIEGWFRRPEAKTTSPEITKDAIDYVLNVAEKEKWPLYPKEKEGLENLRDYVAKEIKPDYPTEFISGTRKKTKVTVEEIAPEAKVEGVKPELSATEKDQFKLPGMKQGIEFGAKEKITPTLEKTPLMEATIRAEQEKIQPKLKIVGGKKKPDIITWIKQKGGISTSDKNVDLVGLSQKESGYIGLLSKKGRSFDVLRDEAEWEGIIPKGITTDEFSQILSDRVMFGKAKIPEVGTKEFEKFAEKAERDYYNELEAYVKGGKVGPLPKYAEKSSINLERLETTDDVKHFINGLTIEQEAKIGKRRIGWEETRQKAEELGWNVDEVKIAFQRKKAFTAAEIEATRQVNINAITDLHTMLKTLPVERNAYTPEMRAKLLDALDSVRITSQVSSEAGRALNIHKKILARDEQFKEISQMNRVLKVLEGKGIKRTDDVIDALKKINFDNPAEVNRFIYNTTKTKYQKLSDVAYEIWINGLLSNPLTHIVNTTSNTLTLMGQYPERLLGASIEKVRAGLGVFGGKTQERFIGETARDAFSVIQGLKNGIKRFFNTMKTGRMTETKLETHVSALAPTVQKFMPARALGAEDELFKGFIQNAELNRLAYRKASQEGLKGKIKVDRIVDLLSNPTEEMLELAAHQAKYLTYQQELGKVGSWIMRGRDTVPGLKYFIPFVRTPANIIKYALERTPANIPRIVYKTVKGELSGGQLSEDMAKVLTGSMVGFGSYLMAKEGYITGGGPKNPAERDELFRIGWLPYAFHIGDKYYSLARLEPLASILGISADFAELEKHMKEDEKINVASVIGSSISKNFTSKTFMQGFSNVNDAISDPGRFGEKFVQNLAGSVIPAVSGGVTRAIDPEIREVKGILDTVRSRIPGLSTGLPTKIDVWGDPIERPNAPLPRFLSPVQVSQAKGDLIDIELTNLKLNLGMPPKKIKGIELEPNEYRQMVIDAGKIAKPELNKIIQESWYKRLTNEEKEKEIRKIMRDARDDARDDALIKVEKRLAMKGKD